MITIIIPIHPEETDKTIYMCLSAIENNCCQKNNIKVILVCAENKNLEINNYSYFIHYLQDSEATTRAKALNIGFKSRYSDLVSFLHCDTLVPNNFDNLIIKKLEETPFCYFKLQFDNGHPALKIVCAQVNNIRNFPYGDQCFCVKADFHIKYGLFPELPFMEDYQYILNIPSEYRSAAIDSFIITSARRYKNRFGYSFKSVFKNVFNNKQLINQYHQNKNIDELSKIYYKNNLLGTHY